jgi:hypothetical protein
MSQNKLGFYFRKFYLKTKLNIKGNLLQGTIWNNYENNLVINFIKLYQNLLYYIKFHKGLLGFCLLVNVLL